MGAEDDDRGVLRFLTCGSVDDGKSTLIGRLLYDTKALLGDTLANLERNAQRRGLAAVDLALLTDGLVAEREQGITIDVAYRYFATPRRSFIIADSPGHVQYTRNMVTAASTADVAVLLVDARKGILAQTRRHATIAGLLGVGRLIVAVNKMDQVDFSAERFASIVADFRSWLERQPALHVQVDYLPLCALDGANVVDADPRLAWFDGPTLIRLLEDAPTLAERAAARSGERRISQAQSPSQPQSQLQSQPQALPLRLPVQWVCRPAQADFRGYAGRVEAGSIAVGDAIRVFPSGATTRVRGVTIGERTLERASAGQSVMVTLEDDIDISRGDLLCATADPPAASARFEAIVCWLGTQALDPRREYLLRQATRETRARVEGVRARLDVETLEWGDAAGAVANDIVRLRIATQNPIAADPYSRLRAIGSFILIDPATNDTVGAGMIEAL
jgi:sulfate adenylyltransferase subunit 1